MIGRLKIIPVLLILLFLAACKSGDKGLELTNHIGKSLSTFERRAGINLTKQSNGVYLKDGVVQVIAPDKKVTSITLLQDADKYTIYGIGIGMVKTEATKLLEEAFGKEVTKTTNTGKNLENYSYIKDERQLFISYDINKETVVGLSCNKLAPKEQEEAAATTAPASTGKLMLMVGDTEVYYNEVMVYLKSAKNIYEADYSNKIWNADILGDGKTFGKMIKEEVINQITELKIIGLEAAKDEIALSEEEMAEAKSYAREHYKGLTEEEKHRYLITEELLQQIYEDNLLANKVFEHKTIDVDTNVSDVEVRQITVQDIYIQNYNLDSEGKKVSLSKEDKEAAYKKVTTLLEKARETEDFRALAEANSDGDTIEYTFGKDEGPKDYGDVFEEKAMALVTGQISDIITTDNGWHILYCVTDFNRDAVIRVKENIIDDRRNEMFSKLYQAWYVNYDIIVDNEAWNVIDLTE